MIGSTTQVSGNGMPAAGMKPHGPPPGMQAAAKALGLSDDDLRQKLGSGSTLADIASQQGVSKDDLVAAVAKGIQENAPAGAPADADPTALAQQLVDGKLPHQHHGHVKRQQADGGSAFSGLLDTVSSLSGTDASQLLSKLQSGTSFGDLLTQSGLSWQDVRASLVSNDGVGLDGYA